MIFAGGGAVDGTLSSDANELTKVFPAFRNSGGGIRACPAIAGFDSSMIVDLCLVMGVRNGLPSTLISVSKKLPHALDRLRLILL